MADAMPPPALQDSATVAGSHKDKTDSNKRKREDNRPRGFGAKRKHHGDSKDGDNRKRTGWRPPRNDKPRTEVAANEDGEKEDRKPKRKVAVMIGYSGTGYKGMQISPGLKTIEGDLFDAFVRAGAISRSNADDPKKSSLARCARTDKGVHAAGNVISLKLIVEEADIVERINRELSPQIRVWGIERTVGSFSCYQSCDSRWYEYLIPSHAFLPPHPSSILAQTLERYADEVGDRTEYDVRQMDAQGFWDAADRDEIQPVLDSVDEDIRTAVVAAIFKSSIDEIEVDDKVDDEESEVTKKKTVDQPVDAAEDEAKHPQIILRRRMTEATKRVKAAYESVKRRYRIPTDRMTRIQQALDSYVGTHSFHNYTVGKTSKDPSCLRNIKSFVLDKSPIYIDQTGTATHEAPQAGGTEWLSLKIHGQSFMMHQIRKMVGMISMLVRCGSDIPLRIEQSFKSDKWSVPKVPGLGLLLERPVFDSYNKNLAAKHGYKSVGFESYAGVMQEFKDREIYKRIFEEEARDNTFHVFFNHLDNYGKPTFLYVTSKGYAATMETPVGVEAGNGAMTDAKGQDTAEVVPR